MDPDSSQVCSPYPTIILPAMPAHECYCLGEEFQDQVELSPDLIITKQSFGNAQFAEGFDVDGILG